MANTCKTCRHPNRKQIEAELFSGVPHRTVAERFGLAKTGVARHMAQHAVRDARQAALRRNGAAGNALLDRVLERSTKLAHLLDEALASGTLAGKDIAIKAAQAANRTDELVGRLTGEIQAAGSTNVTLQIGASMDEARAAVALRTRTQSLTQEQVIERAGAVLAHALSASDPVALRIVRKLASRL